jgi:hypothetical protein
VSCHVCSLLLVYFASLIVAEWIIGQTWQSAHETVIES